MSLLQAKDYVVVPASRNFRRTFSSNERVRPTVDQGVSALDATRPWAADRDR